MVTPTLTRAEDKLIAHARAVLERAKGITLPEEDEAAQICSEALMGLEEASEKHDNLLNKVIHWDAYPWPADDDPRSYAEPFEVALRMAAVDADYAAGYLIEMVGKHIGAEAAAFVGSEGGDSQ